MKSKKTTRYKRQNNKTQMKVENYFLRYAIPCGHVLVNRGDVTQEELSRLENIAENGKEISREVLEKVFVAAFRRIDDLAKTMNKSRWDYEVIREYFLNYHNKIIEQGDGAYGKFPKALCDFCRVEIAKVIECDDNILKVSYKTPDNKEMTRKVFKRYVKDAKVGDYVTIHHANAVEIIAKSDKNLYRSKRK